MKYHMPKFGVCSVRSALIASMFASGAAVARDCPAQAAEFGGGVRSVAMAQGVIAVGAPDADNSSGIIYIYRANGSQWSSPVGVISGDRSTGDLLGNSVAISGDLMIAGAPSDDDFGNNSGAAYIFKYNGAVWNQVAKLHAYDAGSNDFYGAGVSISAERVIVSSVRDDDNGTNSGSAYIYNNTGTGWMLEAKLTASDGAEYDAFGTSVAVSGTTAIVGASEDDDHGNSSGAAYIFEYDGLQWNQNAKIVPADGAASDFFGEAVAISGDRVIIGAIWDDDAASNAGSAYIFSNDGAQWVQQAKLVAFDGEVSDQFGHSVSISGGTAVVGANKEDGGLVDSGAAYIYGFDGKQWTQGGKIQAPVSVANSEFGNAVSVWDGFAVVAATYSTHLFNLLTAGPADINRDGSLNFFDISGFLSAFSAHDPIADFTSDGIYNFFDISAFLQAFGTGCTS